MNCSRVVAVLGVVVLMSRAGEVALAQAGAVGGIGGQHGDADVSIRKSGTDAFISGQTATYTLSVLNAASSVALTSAEGITVVDTLPPNFITPISASGNGWSCSVAGNVVTCHYSGGTVNPGGSFAAITVSAMASEVGRFGNCAVVSLAKVKDRVPADNRNCIRGMVTPRIGDEKYDVGVGKSGPGSLSVGQTGTWTLSTINSGPPTVNSGSGVRVTDTLPSNLTTPITAIGAPNWTCTVSGHVVTCDYTGGPVGPGQPMGLITVTAVGAREGSGRNCVAIAVKAAADAKPSDNRSCVDIVVKPNDGGKYDVSMRKRGPASVTTGQTVTFTLSPNNNGPSSVNNTSGVVVVDTLTAANFAAPITAGGLNWSCMVSGQAVACTYTGTAPAGPGPLPAITITAVARRAGDASNCASIALTRVGPDANLSDNRDCTNVVITPGTSDTKYDLSMRKRGPDSLSAGQTGTFTLSPNNNGPSTVNNASGIVVTDTLPVFFTTPITANGSPNWSCTVTGRVVKCTYVGTTLMNAGPLTPIIVTAVAGQSGSGQNCASISLTGASDANTGDNRDCIAVTVRKPPVSAPLTITKTILDDCYTNNNANDTQCTFHFVITNGGGTAWTGPIVVSDQVSPSASAALVGGQPAGWNCVGASPMVCSSSGPVTIPGNGSVSFNLTLNIMSPVLARQNCATLTSVPATAAAQSPTSCVPLGQTLTTGALTIVKSATPRDSQDFSFHAFGPNSGAIMPFLLDDDAGAAGASAALSNTKTFAMLAAGTYSVSEDLTAGWTVSGIACLPAGSGTVDLVNRAFTVNVTAGANITCTFNNTKRPTTGSLTIMKSATPRDSQDFSFHAFGPNSGAIMPFLLDDDAGAAGASAALSNTKTFATLAAGSYSVSEDMTAGWTVSGIACLPAGSGTVDLVNRAFTVNVTPSTNITCTFSNLKIPPAGTATLTVVKIAQPHDTTGFHFATQGAGLSPFWLDDDGNNSNARSNTKVFTNLPTGVPFTVTEDSTPGWTTPSIQCIPSVIGLSTTYTDQLHRTFTVAITAGVNMTCTVTNVRTGWPSSATVNFYNPMTPFGPQTVDIAAGGTVSFKNVNSGAVLTIQSVSGPASFGPITLASTNGFTLASSPLTIPGNYEYSITGFVVHGHINVH